MIEKHFTTDRHLPGPDQWFSSDPAEFAELARRVRDMEIMLGSPNLEPTPAEAHARGEYRLSCVAARALPPGHLLQEEDIAFRRPASGLKPSQVGQLIGQPLLHSVPAGEPFTTLHIPSPP
jgi:sialic acid synthase SpsE